MSENMSDAIIYNMIQKYTRSTSTAKKSLILRLDIKFKHISTYHKDAKI